MTGPDLKAAIQAGAKAAREIGKSRERTFTIGEGLLALRSQCLIAMGKDVRINDRSILKSAKYRDLMGKALKTYPDYTLNTVFKNDSTRQGYLWCAEHRSEIETLFAQEEIKNPGSTMRVCNPERIKSKFKTLTEPPRKKAANKAADKQAEMEEIERYREEWKRKYETLKAEYDAIRWIEPQPVVTPDAREKDAQHQFDAQPKPKRKPRKAKEADTGGYAPGALEAITGKAKRKPSKKSLDNQDTVN